ncbi:ras guanine nucleotide exchange factor domain-containing protein [Lyophyllum atratum]|nr:ras guanine nucleotide exchange factor domain-containing protein [Lyophyllum atratum]
MAAHGPSSLTGRQSLHVHIDPFTYKSEIRVSPQSTSPPSASASFGTEATPPTSAVDGTTLCSVLCMHEFRSDDPDHLPFSKNEILDIVKQEESGWWAALRSDKDQIGWIPQAFVQRISDEMADKLRNTRKELRSYEYNAEQLYVSAPTDPMMLLYEPTEPMARAPPSPRNPRRDAPAPPPHISSKPKDLIQTSLDSDPSYRLTFQYLPDDHLNASHSPPILHPPYTSSVYSKPTHFLSPTQEDPHKPVTELALSQALLQVQNAGKTGPRQVACGLYTNLIVLERSQRLKASIVDESPQPRLIQAWYLKPLYSDQLDVDAEGHVRYGTLLALVERLTCEAKTLDTQKRAEETLFRNIFLMTFRTFTTADELFDMLVETYRMDHPKDLATAEFEEWKGYLIETQRRVLMVFTMWLEDHRLLEHEPHIASKLTEFLRLILVPPLAAMARLLQKSIQRLTFATPGMSPTSPRRARKSRAHKNDLLKLDPVDIAEQLTLLESKRYVKVTPQDCLRHGSKQASCESNLATFCSTHDKVVAWVKISILGHDALGKRADTIEFWIKVAEKCKAMNNFATMSAVINGLSSTVINRLHLTWAHVGRKAALEGLLRHNEPTGGFSGHRNFTSTYHYSDDGERICFLQRQRSYETINAMLRYQARSYDIAESESTMNFIWRHLLEDSAKDGNWFWTRSQEVQQSELAHADIRKGLEAAGF